MSLDASVDQARERAVTGEYCTTAVSGVQLGPNDHDPVARPGRAVADKRALDQYRLQRLRRDNAVAQGEYVLAPLRRRARDDGGVTRRAPVPPDQRETQP